MFFVNILIGIEKSLLVYCGIEENAFIVIGMNHICFRNVFNVISNGHFTETKIGLTSSINFKRVVSCKILIIILVFNDFFIIMPIKVLRQKRALCFYRYYII